MAKAKYISDFELDVIRVGVSQGCEMTSTGERRVVPKLKAAQNVEEATVIFMRTYLRPGIQHAETRVSFARRYV